MLRRESCTKKRGLSIEGLKNTHNLPEGQTPEPCNNHVLDMYTQSHLAKNMSKQLNTSLSKLLLGVVELANGNVALDLLTQPTTTAEVKLGRKFQTRCPLQNL